MTAIVPILGVPTPVPGLHLDVPFLDYLRWPLLSQSVLKEGRASMAHLKAALDEERVKVPTDDMLLGTALHVAFLEPELMPTRVVLWDGPRRAGAEWDAFEAEHEGKTILTKGRYQSLVGMVRALRRHPVVREWSGRIEATEVSVVGAYEGVTMKARCDALTSEPLVDLKKVASADPRLVTKSVLSFGYHIQAAIYRRLFDRERFLIICVESDPPYDVVAYELSPAFLRQGEREALNLIQRYQFCLKSGVWPGRADEVVMLEPPEWAIADEEMDGITFEGEPLGRTGDRQ